MSDETVRVDRHGPVALVVFENPPLNLLTMRLRAQLQASLAQLRDDDARGIVLASAGDQAFSAGSDAREFPVDAEAGRARAQEEHACCDALAELPQPVVAALHGHTLGGGLELALACDLRIADRDTTVGLPETRLGLFPSGGGSQRLPRMLGPSAGKKMIFLGNVVEAAEAQRLGLVDDVVPHGQAQSAAMELARKIADQPARAVRAAKRAINHGLTGESTAGNEIERELIADLFTSYDAREGISALLESRIPVFEHR